MIESELYPSKAEVSIIKIETLHHRLTEIARKNSLVFIEFLVHNPNTQFSLHKTYTCVLCRHKEERE